MRHGLAFAAWHLINLSQQFWQRLRAERPYARLGVIYDPRSQWLAPADISGWMGSADVALPSCYWDTFAGQQPWSDPGSCVWRAT